MHLRSLGYGAILSQAVLVIATACGDDDGGDPSPAGSGGFAQGGDGSAGDGGVTGGRASGGFPSAQAGEGGESSAASGGGGGSPSGLAGEAGNAGAAGEPGIVPAGDPCVPNPCRNGASCARNVDAFVCACPAGYSGLTCATNVDDCAANPCQNDGTCVDGIDERTCTCPLGSSGEDCETLAESCDDEPCENGATCTDDDDTGYTCACASGFYGPNCDTECARGHCIGAATCNAVDGSGSRCTLCLPGFQGAFCAQEIDECASEPCANGGVCTDLVAGFCCDCVGTWTGATCSDDVDECQQLGICGPFAQCVNTATGFACLAPSCAAMRLLYQNPEPDDYRIDPDGSGPLEPIEVHCDITTDDGASYTLYRIDDPVNLLDSQAAYRAACEAVGLEVVVPRSADHLAAIALWNDGELPNLVNVFPMDITDAAGLERWVGRCQGRNCSYYVSATSSSDCMGAEPDGSVGALTDSLYRLDLPGCDPDGRWGDDGDTVAIPGSVICSTNDSLRWQNCQDILALIDVLDFQIPEPILPLQVDPDGSGPAPQTEVLCDLVTDDGGWMLILATNPTSVEPLSESLVVWPGTNTYLAPAVVQALAQNAQSVQIRTSGATVTEYITSVDPQVILNLRALETLNQETTAESWIGPFADEAHLEQTGACEGGTMYPNIFEACGNADGLHLLDTFTGWSLAAQVPIEVYIR
jgi:hypothetical protein